MQGWMFDIGALLACGLGFFLLISVFRMLLVFSLKLIIVGALCYFGWRNYGPSISLPDKLSDIPVGRLASYAGEAASSIFTTGEALYRDVRANPRTSSVRTSVRPDAGVRASSSVRSAAAIRLPRARALHSQERRF